MADALQSARTNERWGHDYMTLETLLSEKFEEGRKITSANSAIAMLKDNMDEQRISAYTGLSMEEISSLKANLVKSEGQGSC